MTTPQEFPRLVPDAPEASRITNAQIAEYINMEGRGSPAACSADDVKFIRSAACDGFNVWLWSCRTEEGEVYVYAEAEARRFGPTCLDSDFRLTAS
jgi:hypothetical protein